MSPPTLMVPEPAWFTVPVFPPGLDVAVYLVIAEPPLESGAVNATVADVAPVAVAAPIVGAPGRLSVVTEAEALDETEVPAALVAVTVKVYAVLAVRPVMVMVPSPAWSTVPVFPPGFDVAVYLVIAEPPLEAGAVKATVAVNPVAVVAPIVGAPGGLNVVTAAEALDETEVPAEFVAVTVNV